MFQYCCTRKLLYVSLFELIVIQIHVIPTIDIRKQTNNAPRTLHCCKPSVYLSERVHEQCAIILKIYVILMDLEQKLAFFE